MQPIIHRFIKRSAFYLLLILLPAWTSAQWSPNPAVNTFACDTDLSFTFPLVVVNANRSRTYLTGYGLTVDNSGNAIVALEDIRVNDGFSHVYVNAYNALGKSAWDSAGLRMDTNSCQSFSPGLAVTTRVNILVSWMAVYNADSDSE